MIKLLLDHPLSGSRCAGDAPSLLTLPLGGQAFIDHIVRVLTRVEPDDLVVMPTFPIDDGYARRIRDCTESNVSVVQPPDLGRVLAPTEPGDGLLVLDPARWPADGLDLDAVLCSRSEYGGFIHAIAVGTSPERVREQVELDDQGHVKRVQRLYDRVSWPEVATSAHLLSVGPAQAIGRIRFRSLAELRSALAAKGVLSYDLPLALDVVDLRDTGGFLSVSERVVIRMARELPPPGFSLRAPEVFIGPECRIHPSAKLIGPLLLHRGVIVEAGATLVGPAVLGPRSRVRRGAVVAHAVLAAGSVVDAEATVRQCLVSRQENHRPGETETTDLESSAPHVAMREAFRQEGADGGARRLRFRRRAYHAVKRVADVVLSSAALVLLSPLLIVVAILIKWDSPGPVLFAHRREQKGGKEFGCLKFRTMTAAAHAKQRELYNLNVLDGPQFKLAKDPRITRIGHVLRSSNIDELPQLFNVLMGHMSLVGPRPSPFRENQICLPWRRARLSVRPGITGLWQLCRKARSSSDFEQWIFYDVLYVREMSFWLDLRILVATVLSGAGRRVVPLSSLIPAETDARSGQPLAVS